MKISLKICAFITSVLILSSTAVWAAEPMGKASGMAVSADYQPINVNEASAPQIAAALKGIGLKTASAIVAYRTANGPFKTADSLLSVKGVGRQALVKNADVITLK